MWILFFVHLFGPTPGRSGDSRI